MVQITLGDESNGCVVDPLYFDADPDADPGYHVYPARILRDGCRYGVIQERRNEDDASDII